MTNDVRRILEEALKLPAEARGALAGRLIESLDTGVDPDAEEAWDAELRRREEELDTGAVKAIPWTEARRQILRSR